MTTPTLTRTGNIAGEMTSASVKGFTPIVCAPWCSDGDGHREDHPDDQRCRTEVDGVDLSLMPMWEGFPDSRHFPHRLNVLLHAGPRWPAMVVLYECGDDVELRLTATQARRLSAILATAAATLESEPGS